MAHVSIRHAEPDDYEALHRIFSCPRVIEVTPQLPLPSAEIWRRVVGKSVPPSGSGPNPLGLVSSQ
jgi:hypothetical protein